MPLLLDGDVYSNFLLTEVPAARKSLWIATADIKDLHIKKGRRFVPFLSLLNDLIKIGVQIRLLHAKEPGPRFRADFDKFPGLFHSALFERALCPRCHAKIIIVDGLTAYVGSANLTGAGMGAKNENRRNFEAGIQLEDRKSVIQLIEYYNAIFSGSRCGSCQRKNVCPDPIA